MQPQLDVLKKLFRYKIIYKVIGIYIVVMLLLSGVVYASYMIYTSWNSLSELNTEVDSYKSTVSFITTNRELLTAGVDEYNKSLEALIPDEESYFSVVAALEQMAEKTGVTIKTYTIDLESTNFSKLSLRVEITGSEEDIAKLLSNYTFSGGRLITIEKVDLTRSGEAINVFLFNFYHQQYTVGSSVVQEQLTPKDIERMEEIQTQMN